MNIIHLYRQHMWSHWTIYKWVPDGLMDYHGSYICRHHAYISSISSLLTWLLFEQSMSSRANGSLRLGQVRHTWHRDVKSFLNFQGFLLFSISFYEIILGQVCYGSWKIRFFAHLCQKLLQGSEALLGSWHVRWWFLRCTRIDNWNWGMCRFTIDHS